MVGTFPSLELYARIFENRGGVVCLAFEDPEVLEMKAMLILHVCFKTDADDYGRWFCHLRCFKKVPCVTRLCPHERFFGVGRGQRCPWSLSSSVEPFRSIRSAARPGAFAEPWKENQTAPSGLCFMRDARGEHPM